MFFKIFSAFLLIGFVSAIDDPIAEILKYVSVDDIKEGETYSFDFDSHILYDIGPENCTKAGPICATCVDVYECIEIGQGFIVIPLKTCNEDETCQFSTGTCITSHNPECPETTTYAFECYQTGLFPDAINCQKYHMCTVENVAARDSIEMTCSGNYYYDPKTTLCRKRLVNGDCPDPIPDCVEIGNHGIVQGNPWMYYICLRAVGSNKIFPQIFLCPQDSEYNLSTNSCVPSDLNTGIGSDSKCTSGGTFYVPSNCNMFLECSAAGADPVARTCETRTYFNPSTKQCTEFTCADLG